MLDRVRELIRDACAIDEPEIEDETKLADLSLDSLSFVEMIVKLEAAFGVEFADEELDVGGFETAGELSLAVTEKMK